MEMEYSQLKIFIISVAAGLTLKQTDESAFLDRSYLTVLLVVVILTLAFTLAFFCSYSTQYVSG
jgi:hypothetical protein